MISQCVQGFAPVYTAACREWFGNCRGIALLPHVKSGLTGRSVLFGAEDVEQRGADGGGYGNDGGDEADEDYADQ